MNKPTIITSFDDNPNYFSFVKSILQMWNNFGYNVEIGYISDNPDKDIIEYVQKYADLKIFNTIDNIETGVQSKVTRLFLASEKEFFWIVDVDFFVLNINWWEDKFKFHNGENIVASEKYSDNSAGKWPMWSNFGSGKTLKNIINPNNLSYYELLNSWKGIGSKYDKKEDVLNNFNNFSDESLLRRLVKDSNYNITFYKRKGLNPKGYHINSKGYYREVMKRVDRAWNWEIDKNKLYDGYYIDCFPKRPLNENDPIIKEIFNYLKIK